MKLRGLFKVFERISLAVLEPASAGFPMVRCGEHEFASRWFRSTKLSNIACRLNRVVPPSVQLVYRGDDKVLPIHGSSRGVIDSMRRKWVLARIVCIQALCAGPLQWPQQTNARANR